MPALKTENYLKELLSQITGKPLASLDIRSVGGGSINNTYRLATGNQVFFLKTNKAARFPRLFELEKQGLEFLSSRQRIHIPPVIFCGVHEDDQLLLLEWIAPGNKNKQFWEKFGQQLAQLHQCTHPQFGFGDDNYMGSLPQRNTFTDDWISFFTDHRILPQVELASRNNLLTTNHVDLFQQLCKKLDIIFSKEPPSLLHGDLWSGNYMCNEQSEPVLIDPAVYYGHRSIDLAMTTLFGGFDPLFYQSYNSCYPFPSNYTEQWDICNLYPLLIHLNLFGCGYLGSIVNVLKKFT